MKTNENLRSDRRHRSAYQWHSFHASSCLICRTCRFACRLLSSSTVCLSERRGAWRTRLWLQRLNSGASRRPPSHKAAVCVQVCGLLSSQSSPTRSIIYGSRSSHSETCCRGGERSEMLNELAADRSESWWAGFANEAPGDRQCEPESVAQSLERQSRKSWPWGPEWFRLVSRCVLHEYLFSHKQLSLPEDKPHIYKYISFLFHSGPAH